MSDVAPSSGRPVLDKPRARKTAAKILGIAIQTRYRRLLEASGEAEIIVATTDLATAMYENVEFVIWALKSLGGMYPPPPEAIRKPSTPQMRPANDQRFVKPPALELKETDPSVSDIPSVCVCPPLEHGIIGRDRHMTSCPKYVP